MTERERLIELLTQAENKELSLLEFEKKVLADYLLANGVVVLPCKVDDTIYIADKYSNEFTGIDESKVRSLEWNGSFWAIFHDKDNYGYSQGQIGKTVFLTKEETEKAVERSESEYGR